MNEFYLYDVANLKVLHIHVIADQWQVMNPGEEVTTLVSTENLYYIGRRGETLHAEVIALLLCLIMQRADEAYFEKSQEFVDALKDAEILCDLDKDTLPLIYAIIDEGNEECTLEVHHKYTRVCYGMVPGLSPERAKEYGRHLTEMVIALRCDPIISWQFLPEGEPVKFE